MRGAAPRNQTRDVSRRYRAEQYPGILTADPPICRVGPALGILQRCERLRRDEACYCRVYSRDLAEDLLEAGAASQADYLTASLEPEDVEALVEELRRFDPSRIADAELRSRVEAGLIQLARLVRHGSGLTDQYSDDID